MEYNIYIDNYLSILHNLNFWNIYKMNKQIIFGNIVNIFLNTVDAAKALNTTKNNICMACNGKRKSAKGFIFRYEN